MPTFPRGHSNRNVHTGNKRMLVKIKPMRYEEPRRQLNDTNTRDRIVLSLLSRRGDRCYICGLTFDHCDYDLEHIIARSHGGEDVFWNYGLACRSCNARKGNRIISFAVRGRYPCFWMAS